MIFVRTGCRVLVTMPLNRASLQGQSMARELLVALGARAHHCSAAVIGNRYADSFPPMKLQNSVLVLAAVVIASAGRMGADSPSASTGKPPQHVAGIGGFFFHAKNPDALARWYQEKLGVDPVPSAAGQKAWTQQAGPTAFAPFPTDTHFGRKEQEWMINFRVDDLDAMVAQLRASGEKVTVDPTTYPNGRFARLRDPEGNPVELWQPMKSG